MVKERACIFISGTGTNLKFIIKNSRDSNFPINIVLVVSNNNKAFGSNVPVTDVQPKTGGAAPAAPPITIFCGVARFRNIE